MCHGYIDPRFMMREYEQQLRDEGRRPVERPEAAQGLGLVPALVRKAVDWLRGRPAGVPAE